MSKADEMFEKLNFKKVENEETIWYQQRKENISYDIMFLKDKQTISVAKSHFSENGRLLKISSEITMQELQAINEKVKELGWLDA